VFFINISYCIASRHTTGHPQFHIFSCVQARPAATTKGLLPYAVSGHLIEIITNVFDDIPGFFKYSSAPGRIAGIVKSNL
jgi:hypothetical protein